MSDLLLMSQSELSRLEVLQQLDEHRLTQRAGARAGSNISIKGIALCDQLGAEAPSDLSSDT